VIKRKLKTQDLLMPWDCQILTSPLSCSLCNVQPDSHTHLFFECSYAHQVWKGIAARVHLDDYSADWDTLLDSFVTVATSRKAEDIIAKLILAASVYFLWQERNTRIFKQQKRSVQQLIESIVTMVRLKLLSCRFKRKPNMEKILDVWKLPHSVYS